ncbi:uncharacterized protein LOC135166180 [Diachasmimorpha longicaudata]|uniref:uncharacterized protein LOC135166180 n=1 Tax=Diachasmimorpha longicaudata TaxID=58733 RepID=UPI0030B87E47
MNPHNPRSNSPKTFSEVNTVSPKLGNAKASDVTVDSDINNVTPQPWAVDDNPNEPGELRELITWKEIATSPGESVNFDDKRQLEWTRTVERLNRTYLIKESSDVCPGLPVVNSTRSGGKSDLSWGSTSPAPPRTIHLMGSSKITPIPLQIFDTISITGDSLDSARSSDNFMRKRLRRKMNLLRKSTDSLVSSFDRSHDTSQPDSSQMFPNIGVDPKHPVFRQGKKKVSHRERAATNSKNRLVTLTQRRPEPSKNPLVLPPVVPLRQR